MARSEPKLIGIGGAEGRCVFDRFEYAACSFSAEPGVPIVRRTVNICTGLAKRASLAAMTYRAGE